MAALPRDRAVQALAMSQVGITSRDPCLSEWEGEPRRRDNHGKSTASPLTIHDEEKQEAASELRQLWQTVDVCQGSLWGAASNGSSLPKEPPLLDDGELQTILCEVEACLNARPLTFINDGPGDPQPLSPFQLFTGRELASDGSRRFLVGESMALSPTADGEMVTPLEKQQCLHTATMLQVEKRQGWHRDQRHSQDGVSQVARICTSIAEITRPVAKLVVLEPANGGEDVLDKRAPTTLVWHIHELITTSAFCHPHQGKKRPPACPVPAVVRGTMTPYVNNAAPRRGLIEDQKSEPWHFTGGRRDLDQRLR
ncbi:hypothetical protein T03_4457 [Trichinella britovi]|uniref:DUF5641 domain-containing protein n=1 Tax=Trichinella britovi TaxID=45882 RepID=A0A0V1DGI2_TRIBR|nr:hypothetical protein T03_4457 [Trichinella britovi]